MKKITRETSVRLIFILQWTHSFPHSIKKKKQKKKQTKEEKSNPKSIEH